MDIMHFFLHSSTDGSSFAFEIMALVAALGAKTNRYHRQKSIAVLEMESQHAKADLQPLKSPGGK